MLELVTDLALFILPPYRAQLESPYSEMLPWRIPVFGGRICFLSEYATADLRRAVAATGAQRG